MKLLSVATISLAFAALPVLADDIGPDKAMKLVQNGTIKSFEELNGVAAQLHPGAEIGNTELEQEYQRYIYEVELRDAAYRKWEVKLDAANAELLSNREDHD